ncbi:MAG: hypothetical protein U1E87_01420 [Alphaproteobacteria bacterium]
MDSAVDIPWVLVVPVTLWFLYALSIFFAYEYVTKLARKEWAIRLSVWWMRIFGSLFTAGSVTLLIAMLPQSLEKKEYLGLIGPLAIAAVSIYFVIRARSVVNYNLSLTDTILMKVLARIVGGAHVLASGYLLYYWLQSIIDPAVATLRQRFGL